MASEDNVVRLKHLQPLANGISIPNGDNVVKLKHLVSLASAIADEALDSSSKPTPNLSIGNWSAVDTVYSAPITYNGDGELSANVGSISGGVLTVGDSDGTFNGVVSASEGNSFAPVASYFNYKTNVVTVSSGNKPPHLLSAGEFVGNQAVISFDGDGTYQAYGGSLNGDTLTASDFTGFLYAPETETHGHTLAKWTLPLKEHLIFYLPFDNSATEDLCGNTWKTYGSPTIGSANAVDGGKALQLNNASYIYCEKNYEFGGQDFTIDFRAYVDSNSQKYNYLFGMFQVTGTGFSLSNETTLVFVNRYSTTANYNFVVYGTGTASGTMPVPLNTLNHVAIVYQHSRNLVSFYVNGKFTYSNTVTIPLKTGKQIFIGADRGGTRYFTQGSIDEFRVFNGLARWTADFTPPTAEYAALKAQFLS